jgi:hypothetical protein
MRRYALRDDQWDRIKNFLPGREGHVGGTAADNRTCARPSYTLTTASPTVRQLTVGRQCARGSPTPADIEDAN